jgi:hypothetical protein
MADELRTRIKFIVHFAVDKEGLAAADAANRLGHQAALVEVVRLNSDGLVLIRALNCGRPRLIDEVRGMNFAEVRSVSKVEDGDTIERVHLFELGDDRRLWMDMDNSSRSGEEGVIFSGARLLDYREGRLNGFVEEGLDLTPTYWLVEKSEHSS